jgi:hypothetical protein
MTPSEENYVHYTQCIDSLTNAWHLLKALDAAEPGAVRAAAYRMALVEYAKPYKASYGTHKPRRQGYFIPTPNLPPEDVALHTRILRLRDQVLAHSDLTLKEARVYASRVQGRPLVAIGINQPPSFPNTSEVIALIERSLDLMDVQLAQLDEAIAPKA